jgi:hypothetical protein
VSYIQSTLKCIACGHEMNVAFGIVGMTQIAGHPKNCPKCGGTSLQKIADGWHAKTDEGPTTMTPDERAGDPR